MAGRWAFSARSRSHRRCLRSLDHLHRKPLEVTFKTLRDLGDVCGKRVIVREDLNVPMSGGAIADETRIVAALPTLRDLARRGAKTVILSHLGRPDGSVNPKYSLRPIAVRLAELLAAPVAFLDDCIG